MVSLREQHINWLEYHDAPRIRSEGVQFDGPGTDLTAVFPPGTTSNGNGLYTLPSGTGVVVEDQRGGVIKAMYIKDC
jgi:hypothetical protein